MKKIYIFNFIGEYGPKFDDYITKVLNTSNGTWVEFSVVFSLPKTE